MDRAEGVSERREGGRQREEREAEGVWCCPNLEEANDAHSIFHTVFVQQLSVPGVQVNILENVLINHQCEAAPLFVRQCGHVPFAGRDLGPVPEPARLQDGHDLLPQLRILAFHKHQNHRICPGPSGIHPGAPRDAPQGQEAGRRDPRVVRVGGRSLGPGHAPSRRLQLPLDAIEEVGGDEDADGAEEEEEEEGGLQGEETDQPTEACHASQHRLAPHRSAPPAQQHGDSLSLGVGRKRRAGGDYSQQSQCCFGANGVKVAAAAATGERNETVSRWLSLILQRCLCHHGREIGGLGPLVHTSASEGGLAGRVTGGER